MDSMRDFQAQTRLHNLVLLQKLGSLSYNAMRDYAIRCGGVEPALTPKRRKRALLFADKNIAANKAAFLKISKTIGVNK